MSGRAEVLPTFSFDDLLALERGGVRHEWVGGRAYVKAGGTERHDLAAQAVYDALRPGSCAAGCRAFVGNRLLRTATAAYYPDLLIVCGSAAHHHHEADARLVVEVLSPSTADHDRREKAAAYATVASLELYLLVDPDRVVVEVGELAAGSWTWQRYGPGGLVSTSFGVLDVDDLYAQIELDATT